MKRQHMVFFGIAAAVLVVTVTALGISPPTLFVVAFLVLCPLMMLFMMGGMHGGMGDGEQRHDEHPHEDARPSAYQSGGEPR